MFKDKTWTKNQNRQSRGVGCGIFAASSTKDAAGKGGGEKKQPKKPSPSIFNFSPSTYLFLLERLILMQKGISLS